MKRIILGITGSIAAYKTPNLIRELRKAGYDVNVVLTSSAKHFVSPLVLMNISGNPVIEDMFDMNAQQHGAWHIDLAHSCDAMLVAPCSASTLAKIANGICDNSLVALSLALPEKKPLILSPAMDSTMWLSKPTQRNLRILKEDGRIIIPPAEGELSSGLIGPGRMPEIPVIIDSLSAALSKSINSEVIGNEKHSSQKMHESKQENKSDTKVEVEFIKSGNKEMPYEQAMKKADEIRVNTLQDAADKTKWTADLELSEMKSKLYGEEPSLLKGKKILITAGPTVEKIDDVRFISNFSSGKMGYSLASEARNLGAEVVLVSGPVHLEEPANIKLIKINTAQEMYDACIKEFSNIDFAIMSAAVADFTLQSVQKGKIKKETIGEKLTLELVKTKDILFELGKIKKENQKLVGFALESENEIENGWKKMKEKNCDMLVVNSATKPQSGFSGDYNTISILTADGKQEHFQPMHKQMCAAIILNRLGVQLK